MKKYTEEEIKEQVLKIKTKKVPMKEPYIDTHMEFYSKIIEIGFEPKEISADIMDLNLNTNMMEFVNGVDKNQKTLEIMKFMKENKLELTMENYENVRILEIIISHNLSKEVLLSDINIPKDKQKFQIHNFVKEFEESFSEKSFLNKISDFTYGMRNINNLEKLDEKQRKRNTEKVKKSGFIKQ